HNKYIKLFLEKKIYIFCEKPGGNSIRDLNFLNKIKISQKRSIYINYNFLFTQQAKLIKKMMNNKKAFGSLSYVELKVTNGISFKKEFHNNWRFKSKNIFDQISGNVGSHYINLLLWLFKSLDKKNILKSNINRNNDISHILLIAGKNIIVSMYFSYSNPLTNELNLFFSNAILRINDNKIKILKPRDYFNKNKNFIPPPVWSNVKFNATNEYLVSLEKSIKFFLMKVKYKKKIPIKYFNNALETLRFFI
ncbi:hypothetical protein OA845_03470, partial [Candidatus Pelagibacter sp.]|nr:hypothetical protein [Candidatus Pelagibacter sp.]